MAERTTQLAFPGAIGAGAYTRGGTGGAVCIVNSLLDTNEGSYDAGTNTYVGTFRYCLTRTVARNICFATSGVIQMSTSAFVPIIQGQSYAFCSINFQTAGLGGITIESDNGLIIQEVDNLIIRGGRFRTTSNTADCLWFLNCSDVIADHLSISYGGDEAISVSGSTGSSGNVTIQRCFLQESKTGGIFGVDNQPGDFTFAFNAVANTSHRFLNPKGSGSYYFGCNSIYNWKSRTIRITNDPKCVIENNYHYAASEGLHAPGWYGVGGNLTNTMYKLQYKTDKNPSIYIAGNVVYPTFRTTPQSNDWSLFQIFDASDTTYNGNPINTGDPVPTEFQSLTRFADIGEPIPVVSAVEAHNSIMQDVGANWRLDENGNKVNNQDSLDASYISKMQNDTETEFYESSVNYVFPAITPVASYTDSNNDGIPDAWAISKGFTANERIHDLLNIETGYTYIEDFVNSISSNAVSLPTNTGKGLNHLTTIFL